MTDRDLIRELAEALNAPGCERLREWVAIGPAQRAALETFAAALTAARERLAREDQPAAVIEPVCPHGVFPAQACTNPKCAQPAPEPAEPVARELPDDIRVPLHRIWADAGYLIGRAKLGDTDLAVHTLKALVDEVERRTLDALYAAPPSPAPVALSDADLMEIAGMSGWPESMLAPVILAKLREYGRAVEAECRRRMMGE